MAHRRKKKTLYLLIGGLLIAAVFVGGVLAYQLRDAQPRPTTLPSPVTYQEQQNRQIAASPSPTTVATVAATPAATTALSADLPSSVNLAVPFTAQAPHANWTEPYKEFCEEASVLMAFSYLKDEPIAGPDDADQKMLAIKDFEDQTFGYYKDTNAAETARILREYYSIENVTLKENPTVTDIKQALAAGQVVIMPAAGRELGNPNFQTPGPLYHMLVIKGYTADGKFITNDPGTRRGADFIYDEVTIMDAMADWGGDDLNRNRKVIIIVG